jgi:hypothetical protein
VLKDYRTLENCKGLKDHRYLRIAEDRRITIVEDHRRVGRSQIFYDTRGFGRPTRFMDHWELEDHRYLRITGN